jgi:hypothetical protein
LAIFVGIAHIIIMPPQLIIIGMPTFIMFWQHCMNMSFMDASMGLISQVMPFAVIVHVILHIIIGIGMAMADIPPIIGIMPFIIIGFIPAIIGIICMAVFIEGSCQKEMKSTSSVGKQSMSFQFEPQCQNESGVRFPPTMRRPFQNSGCAGQYLGGRSAISSWPSNA